LIGAYGTLGTNLDIHVFYVNVIKVGEGFAAGSAVADYWYDASENDYLYNIFINDATNKPFTAAHELAHLLADAPHESDRVNILYTPTSTVNVSTATKRFTSGQETSIRGNAHVH
jgi:Zn-dependent peptidase ImmA (M78 family)